MIGKALVIAVDCVVWMLAVGFVLRDVLLVLAIGSSVQEWKWAKMPEDKRSEKEAALIFVFFLLGCLFFTALAILGGLALVRIVI